jgi:methionyl-tRNA formyltransferase
MRVIFLGTPEFSVNVLESIINSKHKVVAVVTQPDRKNSRGNKIIFSKVKECAIKNNIPVLQYEKISIEGEEELRNFNADIMVTAAYGQILKQNILDLCKKGIINVHASLLPKYRGSSPVQWALINGEKEVGVTIMQTEIGIDTGDIILSDKIELDGDEDTTVTLDKLSKLGAKIIVNALDLIESGKASYIPQDNELASHCKMLSKEDGLIDWNKSNIDIKNFIRGMTPWPSAYTTCKYGKLKILKSEMIETELKGKVGEILTAEPKIGLIVSCGSGAIKILNLQGENAKAMDTRSYLLGKSLAQGEILGE